MKITAKEFCQEKYKNIDPRTSWIEFNEEVMIEFAKYHVEAALKEASKKATMEEDWIYNGEEEIHTYTGIDKDSIINSYNLENIK